MTWNHYHLGMDGPGAEGNRAVLSKRFGVHWRTVFWAAFLAVSSAARLSAAPINYGDFSDIPPGSVMYLDVTETANSAGDEEPLFGPPTIRGNHFDFNPAGFSATALSGGADTTEGQLSMTISPERGFSIEALTIGGKGDATLFGTGAAAQLRFSTSLASISVLELDGRALANPIALRPSSSAGLYTITDNPGQLQPWSLSLEYDVDAALANAGVAFDFGATKLEIVIETTLSAESDQLSIAYLASKDFNLVVETESTTRTPLSQAPSASGRDSRALAVLPGQRQRRKAA